MNAAVPLIVSLKLPSTRCQLRSQSAFGLTAFLAAFFPAFSSSCTFITCSIRSFGFATLRVAFTSSSAASHSAFNPFSNFVKSACGNAPRLRHIASSCGRAPRVVHLALRI